MIVFEKNIKTSPFLKIFSLKKISSSQPPTYINMQIKSVILSVFLVLFASTVNGHVAVKKRGLGDTCDFHVECSSGNCNLAQGACVESTYVNLSRRSPGLGN